MLSTVNRQKEIYNKDFNWTITIPENFETVTPDVREKMEKRGVSAIEDTYGEKVENKAKSIFIFNSGQSNYFESNYQPFDPKIDGDYLDACKKVNEIVYETFNAQMPPETKIDTATAAETIDNLEFLVYKVKITLPNNAVMNFLAYSRLFGKKEFSVNILYADEEKGKKMKEAWLSSKFSKK